MDAFKIDLHVHTENVSSCGKVAAGEVARYYKKAGYQAIVITDHYYDGYFESLKKRHWAAKIDCFLAGYLEAQLIGNQIGLKVFLGMEIRFFNSPNDFLVYGIDQDFLINNPLLYNLTLEQFKEIAADHGFLIYQAHPFRPGIQVVNPGLLDGVEAFNGNMRHDSRNHLAYRFARENKLRMISGSDFHQLEDLGRGGIETDHPIATAAELRTVLYQNKNFKLLGAEKIAV